MGETSGDMETTAKQRDGLRGMVEVGDPDATGTIRNGFLLKLLRDIDRLSAECSNLRAEKDALVEQFADALTAEAALAEETAARVIAVERLLLVARRAETAEAALASLRERVGIKIRLALDLPGDYPAMDRLRRTRLEEALALLTPSGNGEGT